MRFLLSSVAAFLAASALSAGEMTRTEDVVYARKYGMALVMDVFEPKEGKNGAGVIFCVSGGFFSSKQAINAGWVKTFTDRGYVVFAVCHGSQPRFTIPEIISDMQQAVWFIKQNATKKWGVDPKRLGATGGSAGGFLALTLGNNVQPENPDPKEPLKRYDSRVASVACFFPPTDVMNYGAEGVVDLGTGVLKGFRPPFDFWERDPKTGSLLFITDEAKRIAIGKAMCPIYHVSKDSAPAYVIHGDADKLVPIQQSERMKAAYDKVGAPFELVVKKGADHGWVGIEKDLVPFCDWFDKTLKK
jgi:acetyl esterase/lipase